MATDQSFFRSDLKEFLTPLRAEKVFYCPNPGNGGDSLIAAATYQLFHELDIGYKIVQYTNLNFDAENKVVIFGGGGNLAPYYDQARNFIAKHHALSRRFIILPHTITKNEDLLSSFGDNVDVIAREHVSYNHARTYARRARVLLMHDVALSLDLAELEQGHSRFALPTLREALRFARYWLHSAMNRGMPDGPNLNCFREDVERTSTPIPHDNIDISNKLSGGTSPEMIARKISRDLLRVLRRYETIRTNRLHICIASLLLNKYVVFYDNVYGKNKAIYEYSLFNSPNILWAE